MISFIGESIRKYFDVAAQKCADAIAFLPVVLLHTLPFYANPLPHKSDVEDRPRCRSAWRHAAP
jgi:hypothetical protein